MKEINVNNKLIEDVAINYAGLKTGILNKTEFNLYWDKITPTWKAGYLREVETILNAYNMVAEDKKGG